MEDKTISYYHCGHCTENVCFIMQCPCCGAFGAETERLNEYGSLLHLSQGHLYLKPDSIQSLPDLYKIIERNFYENRVDPEKDYVIQFRISKVL